MAIEITKTFVVKAAPDAVWAFLTDLPRVAKCLPGAAITEKVDDKTHKGTMTVKVGPVQSTYKGTVVFERLDAAARVAELSAIGQDVKGRGGADMKIRSSVAVNAAGETEVTAVSAVNVSGILAQLGRGMIQDVSDQLFQIFSQRIRAELEAAQPPGTSHPNAITDPNAVTGDAGHPTPPATPAVALDLGSIGAKAAAHSARRAASNPVFWIAFVAAAAAVYFLLRSR